MTLKNFSQTSLAGHLSFPSLSINMASYNLIFNVAAIDLLKIKRGNGIIFSQDTETTGWYFYKSTEEEAFPLRKFTTTPQLVFSCKNLCQELYKCFELSGTKNLLTIHQDAEDYCGLKLFRLAKRGATVVTTTSAKRKPLFSFSAPKQNLDYSKILENLELVNF